MALSRLNFLGAVRSSSVDELSLSSPDACGETRRRCVYPGLQIQTWEVCSQVFKALRLDEILEGASVDGPGLSQGPPT